MNTLVKNFNGLPSIFNELLNENHVNSFAPLSNIIEKDDSFTVDLAVPGFSKEDFKIEVHERNLKVSAEKQTNTEEATQKYLVKEFGHKSFTKSFRLPNSVESDNIEATYHEGILSLSIPKKEEAKPKEPRLVAIQ